MSYISRYRLDNRRRQQRRQRSWIAFAVLAIALAGLAIPTQQASSDPAPAMVAAGQGSNAEEPGQEKQQRQPGLNNGRAGAEHEEAGEQQRALVAAR